MKIVEPLINAKNNLNPINVSSRDVLFLPFVVPGFVDALTAQNTCLGWPWYKKNSFSKSTKRTGYIADTLSCKIFAPLG